MNFFTHKIVNPAGDGGASFDEWLAEFLTKHASQEEKVASEAKPGLGQDTGNEPRGQQRGQVINNDNEEGAHSYQEGESVDGKNDQGGNARKDKGGKTDTGDEPEKQTDKGAVSVEKVVEATCGKEMGGSDDAGKVTEDHTEAGPGDDENPEPKILINNDPNYQKGESTDPAKAKGDSKKQPGEPVAGKSSSAVAKFEKIASLNRKKKLQLFAYLSAQKSNTHLPQKTAEGTTRKPSLAYVEAMVGETYANMQDDEKEWFRAFWNVLYPESYVEEMVADR
jgi:hypothetical protein